MATSKILQPRPDTDHIESHILSLESSLMGGLYWPADKVEKALEERIGIRVLDVGSASGIWAANVAEKFPNVSVLGIDQAPTRPSDTPPNCSFETLNPETDDMKHLEGMFDVVHCRRNARRTTNYKVLLSRVVKTLKPGGLYLHYESDVSIYDDKGQVIIPAPPGPRGDDLGSGAYLARVLNEIPGRAKRVVDMPIQGWGNAIHDLLKEEPSLVDVARKDPTIYARIGTSESSDTIHLGRAQSFRDVLINGGMDAEQVDEYLDAAEKDVELLKEERFGAWHLFTAFATANA